MSEREGDRSQPQNMEDILRLAVANTAENPDLQPQSHQQLPLTEERREFLQSALSAVSGPGPVDRVKQIVQTVHDYLTLPLSSEVDEQQAADAVYEQLGELAEWCEDIDLACDFHKIGGFKILSLLEASEDDELRWRCGDLIATFCQNNPYCQEKITEETDQLGRLMALINCDSEKAIVKVKAVYALSGMLRGNAAGQTKFSENDGYSLLMRAMQSDNDKLKIKATFLLMGIMKDDAKIKASLTSMGYVEQLLSLLTQEHSAYHEHVMAALLELVTENTAAVTEANRAELHMATFLSERIKLINGQPEYEEELGYAKQIRETVFSSNEQSVDR